MKLSRCRLLLLLAMPLWHSVVAQHELGWDSVSGPFYREGYWWAIAVDLPPDFPGSRQKLVAAIDSFHVSLDGKDAVSGNFFGYFLISGASPKLVLEICDDSGRRVAYSQKVLGLQRLSPGESLVGIYGSESRSLGISGQRAHYLPEIPDYPEALQIFDLLVWDAGDMDVRDMEILRMWVDGGGNLFLPNPDVLERTHVRDWLRQCSRHPLPPLTCWRSGTGKVISAPGGGPMPSMWPAVLQAVAQNVSAASSMPDIFPPQPWDKKLRRFLWLLSTALFAVCSGLAYRLCYRHSRIITAAVLVAVGGAMWSLQRETSRHLPVEYQRLTLTRLVENQPLAIQEDYHYFRSLRRQDFSCPFSELPMPLCSREGEPEKVFLHRRKTGWEIQIPAFDGVAGWRTRKVSAVLGQIRIEDGALARDSLQGFRISNETPHPMGDCVYLDGEDILPIGDFPVGESVCPPSPDFTHSIYHLPDSWAEQESLLSWFRQGHPHRVVLGYGPHLPAGLPQFAAFRQMHVVWFTLSF